MLSCPFGYGHPGLSYKDAEYVELVQFLLSSAEMVINQQFDHANELLSMCDQLSNNTGNPIQRVVYYFVEALREKINRETGRNVSKGLQGEESQPWVMEEAIRSLTAPIIACYQELPFNQVTKFTGMQAILEYVASAKKIHLIDLAIDSGVQWTILMQGLVDRYEHPLELLKITVVETSSKEWIDETGKRLACFAEALNLPFSFKIVIESDMKDLREDLFDLETGEVIAVCSTLHLRTILARPDQLESLMKVIRNIRPCVMVVTEIDANTNLPVFTDRLTEVLFFYSAYFDCLESCMDRKNPNRMTIESPYLSQGIRNIITTEGKDRFTQHMRIDAWREFFARFGMVEAELSMSSLYQASLVVMKFACWSSCTLDMNGKCLLVGWKGMPILSLSVWKFHQERRSI